ncbi:MULTISPECIES: prepilin-type N-terminal cleavage/methylation domain-containing protein [Burkholderiaceae]|nr:prepilin-type N-terminal cleavage/methylation domain-containing protein [Caballeronia sordidicola]
MSFRCSPGFTLTELAVVLAVIAVIATFFGAIVCHVA